MAAKPVAPSGSVLAAIVADAGASAQAGSSTMTQTAFSKVKQSPALEALVDLNLALSELATEEAALTDALADVLTPAEPRTPPGVVAPTGGIEQRIRHAIARVNAIAAAVRDTRLRAECLCPAQS